MNNTEGFLLQVTRASYISHALDPPARKLPNFFSHKFKLIKLLNIHFSIFHLHVLHVIKFPFNT